MRRRLQQFLPIVLIALAMQILAPIAACWATSIAAADPVQSASICHAGAAPGAGDQDGEHFVHGGFCAICVSHVGAAVDAPRALALIALARQLLTVLWPDAALTLSSSRTGSNTQARAPPRLT